MILIEKGTIVDGTGKPGFVGSVLVDGERITDVWPAEQAPRVAEAERIDATGLIVSPGFIDAHAHSDAYLVLEPDAPSKLAQGITTEINGQCGGSVVPRYGEARLSSDWAALLGDRLSWHSLNEYRAVLNAAKIAINTVQFVGHNTLRASVVGYAGREATGDELRRMQRLLEESLESGGWGLTTGLIYQPGKYATNGEVLALVRTAAAKGGFYATHMRSEGDRLLESIDEVIALARATGIRAEISHLKTGGRANWHKIDAALEKVEGAIRQGDLIGSDRYPFCAAGTDLDIVLPDWAQEGAAPAEVRRLANPELRAQIEREIDASGRDWSTVMLGGTWTEANRRYSGRTVGEILAENPTRSAGEIICDILAGDGAKTGAFFFTMSEANLDKILSRDWIVPGSDASLRAPWGPLGADHPHPRAYGTMPEFYRRVRQLGVSREATIARMTSVPARRFEIAGRGVIEKGAYADLAIWNEDEFACAATYARPHKFARGVKAVFVNGVRAESAGEGQPLAFRDARRGGRFLERGR